MRSGGLPAGSGRALRLDPFALPVRFAAIRCRGRRAGAARGAASRTRRGAALARRHAHGAQHAGLGLCRHRAPVVLGEGEAKPPPPSYSNIKIPRSRCRCLRRVEADEAFAEWRAWGNVLGLPLLVAEDDGGCASRSRGWARCASSVRARAGAAAARSSAAVRRCRCAARPASHRRDAGPSRRARDHRQELDCRRPRLGGPAPIHTAAASACRPAAHFDMVGIDPAQRVAGAARR